MAENFSDIIDNYKDMSVSELGSSLLQRKGEQERAARKAAKKNARVEQAFGLLLAGQAVFKNAYKRRAKELESAFEFQLKNNETSAKEINMLSKLTQPMYQWSQSIGDQKFANDEEKLNSFVNSEYFDSFRQNVGPYSETAFKQMMGDRYEAFKQTSSADNVQVEAAKQYAKRYLEKDKDTGTEYFQTAVTDLENIFSSPDKDMDKLELFRLGSGLTHHDLNEIERKNYQTILNSYKDDANIISGISNVFQRFSKKNANKGGLDLFETVDEKTLLGPSIDKTLKSLNFKGMTNEIVNDNLVMLNRSSVKADIDFNLPKNKKLRDSLSAIRQDLSSEVDSDTFSLYSDLSRDGKANIISRSALDDLFDNMSELEKEQLEKDGGQLSLLLNPKDSQNEKFLRGLYASNHKGDTNMTFQAFKNKLENETFRVKYGITLAASEGYKGLSGDLIQGKGLTNSRYIPETGDIIEVTYDRYSGSLPILLNEGIIKQKNNYTIGEGWNEFSQEQKLKDFNSTLLSIAKKNVSEQEKDLEMQNLFRNVPNPLESEGITTYTDYMQTEQFIEFTDKVVSARKPERKTSDIELISKEVGRGPGQRTVQYVKNYVPITQKIDLTSLTPAQLRYLSQMSNDEIATSLGTTARLLGPTQFVNPLTDKATKELAKQIRAGEAPRIPDIEPIKPSEEFFNRLIQKL